MPKQTFPCNELTVASFNMLRANQQRDLREMARMALVAHGLSDGWMLDLEAMQFVREVEDAPASDVAPE